MANIEPIDTHQTISDDQELAKVLAGVNQQADDQTATDDSGSAMPPVVDDSTQADEATSEVPPVVEPSVSETPAGDVAPVAPLAPSGDLDAVKQQALSELRPLVDKLDVSAEEKFDTYLLLLRSTDDRELIAPAHEAAKSIADEARRASALLDIIKEIDFLSQNQK